MTVAIFAETTFGGSVHIEPADALRIAQDAASFKGAIPNALEALNLTFRIDGVSRATTHQLVRTRVGAGFGQFGQRANPMGRFNTRLPQSVMEAMTRFEDGTKAVEDFLSESERLYDAMLAGGVPYQDARYILPQGVETSITATYNLLSLIGTVKRRICNRMQWEINYVARRMHDLAVDAYPWIGKSMRSGCERTGVCQTIDPMFPPSCVPAGKIHEWCHDHPVLRSRIHSDVYSFDRGSNDAVTLFGEQDIFRIGMEQTQSGEIWSMADKVPVLLAAKDSNGLWRHS